MNAEGHFIRRCSWLKAGRFVLVVAAAALMLGVEGCDRSKTHQRLFVGMGASAVAHGGEAAEETKWGPKLGQQELSRIAGLPKSELLDMLQNGDTLHAYAALKHLKADGGWKTNFDALLGIAAEGRGDMIVEGLIPRAKGPGPQDERVFVDRFLDFLEAQLSQEKSSVSKAQAIRSIAKVVYRLHAGTPKKCGQAKSSEPPYANSRVRNILMAHLNHREWQVRGRAISWLGIVGANEIARTREIIAALESQRDKEASSSEKAKVKEKLEKTIERSVKKLRQAIVRHNNKGTAPMPDDEHLDPARPR